MRWILNYDNKTEECVVRKMKEPGNYYGDKISETVLEVRNLDVYLNTYAGRIHAVRNVNFTLKRGETLVVVGESGCGKSMTARAIMQLLPEKISEIGKESQILFKGRNILEMTEKQKETELRGKYISMIFQDPTTFLNPTMTVGDQIAESLILHGGAKKKEANEKALELLSMVKITNPEKRIRQYPHELSGGMRQRVMIAMALACEPQILIADEPTTALDVTTQADIMELIKELQEKMGTSVILVTHDLGIASEVGDRIQVMYAGEIIESGTKREIFKNTIHPYTWALMKSVPSAQSQSESRLYSLQGTPPDLITPPGACAFAPRCEYCMEICKRMHPFMLEKNSEHIGSCWLMHPKAPKPEFLHEEVIA